MKNKPNLKNNFFLIDSCSIGIKIETNFVNPERFIQEAGSIIPNMKKCKFHKNVRIYGKVIRGRPLLSYGTNRFIVVGDYSEDQQIRDSIMVLSRYLEREFNNQGKYSIHSSALCLNKKGIILAGEGGSGKTTSAVYVGCLDERIKIISGDRTIIDLDTIYGGTSKLLLKKGSLIYELPKFNNVDISTEYAWTELHTILLNQSENFPIDLCAIFLPRKADCFLEITEYSGDKKFLRINGNIAQFSDTHPNICLGQRKAPPYFNTEKSLQKRIDFASKLESKIPVIGLVGRLNDIGHYLKDYLTNITNDVK